MAPTRDTAMGSLQTSQNAQLTLVPCDDSEESAQRAFRSRSDSLDIFTMSPLGTPLFDSDSQVGPSTPLLRLPEPPALDLDLGVSKSSPRVADIPIPYHSPSPPSTPNSPTSFSFSPPRHTSHKHIFDGKAYPFKPQSPSVVGGTSYDTDMTSVVGSWDDKHVRAESPITPILDDKGKAVQQEPFDDSFIALEPSSSKGKGKAVDECSISSSPCHKSFGFDFEFQHVQDPDLEFKSIHGREDRCAAEGDASYPPVVRLSPGSQYRQFGEEGTGVYAGPSSRNGDVASRSVEDVEDIEDVEDASSSPGLGSSQEAQASSASSSPSPSPPPLSGPSSSRLTSEASSGPRLPAHRRSLSSISLRSIRSSSSRSIASIRSTFTGPGIHGKVRSMVPAARKLKGGLRKMFKRNPAEESEGAVAFTLSDGEDDSDDEADPPRQARPSHLKHSQTPQESHVSREEPDLYRSESVSCSSSQGHALEASSQSQATVTHKAVSGTVCVLENITKTVGPALPTKPRSTSEPRPFTNRIGEPEDRSEQGEHSLTEREPTENMEQLKPEVVVTLNCFNDKLPRELQLAVLKALVEVHEEQHQRALRGECLDQVWSVRAAGKSRWVGRDKGLRELVKFTRVSKTWQSLAFDGQLWDALHLTSSPPHFSPALLLRLAEHAGPFVRSLALRGWTHLDPVTLRALMESLSINTMLDILLDPQRVTNSMTAPSFPPTNLTHICLRTCTSLTTHSLHHVLLRAPCLRSVDLRGLSAVTNTTCGVLSAYCPRLEVADLGRCANMDGEGIRYLLGDSMLARSWTSEEGNLPITARDVVTGQSDCPTRLRVLRVSGLKRLNAEDLSALGKRVPSLEVLDLSGARDLTDEAIEAFIMWDETWDSPSDTSCQRKVELTFREMGRDPLSHLGPCIKRLTRLRHLNLSSCFRLTDLTCTHLAHCVPQLEFLELAGIGPELKDEGLVRLLATTPLLRRLDLEDAADVTDAVLEVLTSSPPSEAFGRGVRVQPPPLGQNLEHLILSYAFNITNDALLSLIRRCQRLKVLECDNTRISGAVLREFVKLVKQRQLRGAEIVAVDCRAITETLVKDLASSGRIRARKGFRHYEARLLGYVDSRDKEDLGAVGILGKVDLDDCDDSRVTLKSFWSWQTVDAVRQAREKRRKMALSARRNTDAGVLGEVFRQTGNLDDEDEQLFRTSDAGPSSRPRWLTQWAGSRSSGSGSSSPSGVGLANDEERGCIIM